MDSGLKLDCILNFQLSKELDYSKLFSELNDWLKSSGINRIFLLTSEKTSDFINIENLSFLPEDISDNVIVINKFFDFDLNFLFSFHLHKNLRATIPVKIDYESGSFLLDDDFNLLANSSGEGFNHFGCFVLKKDLIGKEDVIFNDKAIGLPIYGEIIDLGKIHSQIELEHIVYKISEIRKRNKLKVVFLDRDGIINEDLGYVYKIEDLKFKNGLFEFMNSIEKYFDGFVITTNQAGIAKGKFTEEDYFKFQDHLERELINKGFKILGSFYCPYHKDGVVEIYRKKSLDRKPEPGMFLKAAERFNIDLTKSVMIGDKESDRIKLPYLKSYILKGNYEIKNNLNVYGSFEEILKAILDEKVY